MTPTPTIVVLDGHTLNPGDLSWDPLRRLGPATVYDRTSPPDLLPRARDAAILLTNKTVLDRPTLLQFPTLRYIGVLATGYNIVDVHYARERGIPVANVPAYGAHAVAEMTFAHILELARRVGHHAQTVRDGRWSQSPDFCYWNFPQVELHGLTIGILGYGRIGRQVASIARSFGMKILAHSVPPPPRLPVYVSLVPLDELFTQSDVVTLHCPLTPETHHLVNADRLRLMKPTAFLVNTSRGPLVDEQALADALNAGRLAGAGLDVLEAEPPPPSNPLLQAQNCLITPHISWTTTAARRRLMDIAVSNVKAFLTGRPQNVVNP